MYGYLFAVLVCCALRALPLSLPLVWYLFLSSVSLSGYNLTLFIICQAIALHLVLYPVLLYLVLLSGLMLLVWSGPGPGPGPGPDAERIRRPTDNINVTKKKQYEHTN